MNPPPFRVFHSGVAREQLLGAITSATAAGVRAEAVAAAHAIERGLYWYADGFGELRQQMRLFGEVRWAAILPLTVWFAVDHDRREVQVSRYRFVRPHRRPGAA